ncbi:hypothetical protein GCM10010168_24930 [Actinoplanes ianthinogenes]|uniref:Uncharacterized protein n=1 Tax=Actinoplanes ianthinogenes TaxID=122358 RepID=A0ABN6CSB8_9ACTN|nr:hypothetical protein [Actinoplanes ianthinogenes]BCJ48133.1 hypothetical protein Aiant_87900 [Actinoplanes ianthinogenes]GGR06663.1 hypothetical protein GCM10010168_24930 [Actinoplanes ianthinogenes]
MQLRHDFLRDETCLSSTNLAERGWTAAAIRLFLGEPDRIEPHPVLRAGPPVRLFRKARVLEAEASENWQRWRDRSVQRAVQSRAAAIAQRAAILAEIAALEIRVPMIDEEELARRARAFRIRRHPAAAADDPDPGTLRRWMVAYLRRETRVQDSGSLHARASRAQATPSIRASVYAVIAAHYPALAAEARRQAAESGEIPP